MTYQYPETSSSLLEKVKNRDAVSWAEFAEHYRAVIFAIARGNGLSPDECQEIFQQSMVRFFEQSDHFTFDAGIAKFRTWFNHIVIGKIRDVQRRRKTAFGAALPLDTVTDFHLSEAESPDERLDTVFREEWRKQVLAEALYILKRRVEPDTWQIFELYVVQGRSAEKVAAFAGCTNAQVYSIKNRVLTVLRKIYGELEAEDPELELLRHGL